MSSVAVYVGLDYHAVSVQVCATNREGEVLLNRRCENSRESIAGAVQEAAPGRTVFAGIEACTGAADLADELIHHVGWSVDLAHPGYVARMKQNPDKHDYGDARILSDLERVGYLPKVWLAPQEIRELRRLVRHRQQVVDDARSAKLRIRALLREHRVHGPSKAWTVVWRRWLEDEAALPTESRWIIDQHQVNLARLAEAIKTVEARLHKVTANDPMVKRLLEQPGVGPVTAWTLRAEIGRFDRFRSGKQLAKFCSVTPRNASSGQRQADAGLIRAGNRQVRTVLIELAHRLARYNPRWSALAARLRSRGKPGSVVAAAIANRWVRWLFHQMHPQPQVA
jgi:transposase